MTLDGLAAFFSHVDIAEVLLASGDTLLMLVVSLALTVLLGLPLGVWLWIAGPGGSIRTGSFTAWLVWR